MADENGYRAEVFYEGEAHYDEVDHDHHDHHDHHAHPTPDHHDHHVPAHIPHPAPHVPHVPHVPHNARPAPHVPVPVPVHQRTHAHVPAGPHVFHHGAPLAHSIQHESVIRHHVEDPVHPVHHALPAHHSANLVGHPSVLHPHQVHPHPKVVSHGHVTPTIAPLPHPELFPLESRAAIALPHPVVRLPRARPLKKRSKGTLFYADTKRVSNQ